MGSDANTVHREPWNKGKIVGQKAPFKLKDIWALRVRLQMQGRVRELALFNLGIDSKLRGCDLVRLKVRDVRAPGGPRDYPRAGAPVGSVVADARAACGAARAHAPLARAGWAHGRRSRQRRGHAHPALRGGGQSDRGGASLRERHKRGCYRRR